MLFFFFWDKGSVFVFSGIKLSYPAKASPAAQVCMDAQGTVVTDPDKQPLSQVCVAGKAREDANIADLVSEQRLPFSKYGTG